MEKNIEEMVKYLLWGYDKDLKEWYSDNLSNNYDYIVYITNRPFLIANLLSKITIPKQESHGLILTDSGLLLQCKNIAEKYRNEGRMPRILIKQDILFSGKSISNFMEHFEKSMIALLPEYSEDKIVDKILDSVEFSSLIRVGDGRPTLMPAQYENKLHYKKRDELKYVYSLLNGMENLIINTTANECYNYSFSLSSSDIDIQKLKQNGFIETVYQGTTEYTKVICVEKSSSIKAILTLRIIENRCFNEYRVVPFVLMPNMSEDETKKLVNLLYENRIIDNNIYNTLNSLYEQKGKINFSELLTLVLSSVVLKNFNDTFNITQNSNDEIMEIEKLIPNYYMDSIEKTKQFLNSVINTKCSDINKISQILSESINHSLVDNVGNINCVDVDKERIVKIVNDMEDTILSLELKNEKDRLIGEKSIDLGRRNQAPLH